MCRKGRLNSGPRKSERSYGGLIRRGLPVFFRDHAETSGIVPHGPADVVAFELCAHILEPGLAVVRIGIRAVHAELVADQRHIALLRPIGSLIEFGFDAGCTPMILT